MDHDALTPRILKALDEATAKLEAIERQKNEPVAIIGMACRMPAGVATPEAYWRLLADGIDAISEIPASRWLVDDYYDADHNALGKIYSRYGGFLHDVDRFDAAFFGISPREAVNLDPQQRLLLEVSWEALENAGQTRQQYAESRTGVFIGVTSHDYSQLLLNTSASAPIDPYFTTGNTLNATAGRLSYFLGLQGPSMAIDTACSSSLTAIHLASQSLRNGESEMCLAGASNLILTPEPSIALSRAGMLAADGRCKTFDASADGYVRGEGCAVVVLKLLSKAQRDGDPILALIRGTAVNQDGASGGFTVPSALAQQALIRDLLAKAQVKPADVHYLEAHGTGTSLGDPIEISAAAAVYGKDRTTPLVIGSVKTNIGHLEAASGIAGLMKVVLSLHYESIPPHLHFKQPNPHISWGQLPVTVPTTSLPWPRQAKKRLAGVSSFGASGTNGHLLIEEAPEVKPVEPAIDRPFRILTLSAKTESALQQLAASFAVDVDETLPLADIVYSANTGRNHFNHRLAVVGNDWAELRQKLASVNNKGNEYLVFQGQRELHTPKIAFLFTGQGSQYINMGRELYETQALFRKTLQHCDALLQRYLGHSILELMYPTNDTDAELLHQTAYTQPVLFALEFALAKLWGSFGIQPAAVMGHSVGEYAAACIAGVFSLEDGLQLIAARGRLMQALPLYRGKMVVVEKNVEWVQPAIEKYPDTVAIAAINGPDNVTISGAAEVIDQLTATFARDGIKTVELNVSHAFHSPLMEPMLDDFREIAGGISYAAPRIPLYSNVTGGLIGAEIANPNYWVNHIRQPVLFAAGLGALTQRHGRIFVEIGPKPTLSGMAAACVPVALCLPSLRPGNSDWRNLLGSLAQLYVRGADVDWRSVDDGELRRIVRLPNYPWQKQAYWPQTGGASCFPVIDHSTINGLAQQLAASDRFNEQELKLLPKLLDALASGQQQQRETEALNDLFYQVDWRLQPLAGLPSDYLLSPGQIRERLAEQLNAIQTRQDLNDYWVFIEQLESLSVDYILSAFKQLGFSFVAGQSFTSDALAGQFAIVQPMRRLFTRLLHILSETGVVDESAGQWLILTTPAWTAPAETVAALTGHYPGTTIELTLLARCGERLADVLTGQCEPLGQLLFPENAAITAAHLYQDALGAKVMNELVQQAVSTALSALPPNRKLRILEIGAGTGGTSAYILPKLPVKQVDYVYTDVSPLFLTQAQIKFKDYPFIDYRLLNIEQTPESQGFADQRFDLVIGANVVHATRDLQQTVKHSRQLLVANGLLVLLENTGALRFIDLIFGLTEGWWRFTDAELRVDHPLISTEQWRQLLIANGFVKAGSLSAAEGSPSILAKQAVIFAQADAVSGLTQISAPWLVFADRQGIAGALRQRLQADSKQCVLVFPGSGYQQVSPLEYRIDPQSAADYQRLLMAFPLPPEQIVFLSGWLDPAEPVPATYQLCNQALWLVQSVVKETFVKPPRLCFITQNAVTVVAGDAATGLAGASLWGLGKVIGLEHPELRVLCLDIAADNPDCSAAAIIAELAAVTAENQIAVRGDRRYAARLVHYRSEDSALAATTIQADASYLITGGLGGLGLAVADWLIGQGAKALVLVGRQKPGPAAEAKIAAWRQTGVQVLVAAADVGIKDQVAAVFADLIQSMPVLRGIIHAAGTLDDGVLMQQTPARFAKVMAAKVDGGWHLHEFSQGLPLDFFVLFSTTVSLLGSGGQGNHATANAFMDALAYYRRARGLPAQAINWGPWAQIGAASNEAIAVRVKTKGATLLTTEQGINAWARLLREPAAQIGVIAMDWSQLPEPMNAWPFFADVVPAATPSVAQVATSPDAVNKIDFRQQFQQASGKKQRIMLIDLVRSQIAAVLSLPDPAVIGMQQGFFELGMDSLVSVEFRNRLQVSLGCLLPATLSFDYPNMEAVADYLLSILTPSGAADIPCASNEVLKPAAKRESEAEVSLDQLSEQQLGDMLDCLLGSVEEDE